MFEKIGTGLAEHSQNLFIFPFPLSSLFSKQNNEIFFLSAIFDELGIIPLMANVLLNFGSIIFFDNKFLLFEKTPSEIIR